MSNANGIKGITEGGVGFEATLLEGGAGPSYRLGYRVEIPSEGLSFAAVYDKSLHALVGRIRGSIRDVGIPLQGRARTWVLAREAEAHARREEARAAMQAERDAQPRWPALVISGPAQTLWAVGYVRGPTDAEYRAHGARLGERLVYLVEAPDVEDIAKGDVPTARLIASDPDREQKTLAVESRVLPISEEEHAAILAESQSARTARAAKNWEQRARRQAALEQARRSGEWVRLRHDTMPCPKAPDGCTSEIYTEWALPDGTTLTRWMRTW